MDEVECVIKFDVIIESIHHSLLLIRKLYHSLFKLELLSDLRPRKQTMQW
jgi:hypothetical protein